MHRNRTILAGLLLAVLTVGSVVAPLSHFVFMAVSDAHAMPSTMDAMAHHGHQHGSHAMAMPVQDGPAWHTEASAHELCTYADLFATPLAGDLSAPLVLLADASASTLLLPPSAAPHIAALLTEAARGPPAPVVFG